MLSIFGSRLILNKLVQHITLPLKEKTNRKLCFELDDKRKVKSRKSNNLLLSHMDIKTLEVEDIYLLLTEFEVRTVSYGPS